MWSHFVDMSKSKVGDATFEAVDLNNFSTEFVESTATISTMKELKQRIQQIYLK